jgi:hypothetical protein
VLMNIKTKNAKDIWEIIKYKGGYLWLLQQRNYY